jgi:hypothetical protein
MKEPAAMRHAKNKTRGHIVFPAKLSQNAKNSDPKQEYRQPGP